MAIDRNNLTTAQYSKRVAKIIPLTRHMKEKHRRIIRVTEQSIRSS